MSLTVGELIDKATDQRLRGRYAEALLSAIAATELESENANAWWQVSLNRWRLGDAKLAIIALERTAALAPHFAPGWARLGTARLKNGNTSGAFEDFKTALECDVSNEEALQGTIQVLEDFEKNDPQRADAELLLSVLTRLDQSKGLSADYFNKIGILHYNNENYYDAINYWKRSSTLRNDPASLFNLGLVYNHPDIAQTADAVDIWRLTRIFFPDYKPPQDSLSVAVPAAVAQAKAARTFKGKHLLSEDQWYVHYLNPFELLNCPPDIGLNDLDGRALKGFKDKLLREIELEDGMVSWIPGTQFDKSKAIRATEELSDNVNRECHWRVFRNRPLLDFLSRGGFEHFLVDDARSPIPLIEALDVDAAFREWLSEPFAKQFDLVLSKAIEVKNPILITCLLAGRRWVTPPFIDACFQSAHRQIDRFLQPLRDIGGRASHVHPSVKSLKSLLNENLLLHLLNSLPIYFRPHQDEAAQIIRDVAPQAAFTKHSDIDLAKEILQISNQFRKTSANVREQIADDFNQIDKIIEQEREREVRLWSGDVKWEITKHGALIGSQNIPADKVTALRWGTLISRQSNGASTYDFLLAVKDGNGTEIRYNWRASHDIEKHEKNFDKFVDAAFNYLFPVIVKRIEGLLKAGQPVGIGPCSITKSGISFETKGWFSNHQNTVPWERLGISIVNGDLTVFDKASEKTKTSMTLRTTDNATVLRFLAQVRKPD